MRTTFLRSALGGAVVSVLLTACGGQPVQRVSTEAPADLGTVLQIVVSNDQLDEARTWLWVDSQRQVLGTVRSNETKTFFFPLDGPRELHLEFDVTLGQRCVTTDATYGPGERVAVRIPANTIAFAGVCRPR